MSKREEVLRVLLDIPRINMVAASNAADQILALDDWVSVDERLPEIETPVLIWHWNKIRIAEIRIEHPGREETYKPFEYWDDPINDGQDIEWGDVSHWEPLPEPPRQEL